jgi:hypothetical protein
MWVCVCVCVYVCFQYWDQYQYQGLCVHSATHKNYAQLFCFYFIFETVSP